MRTVRRLLTALAIVVATAVPVVGVTSLLVASEHLSRPAELVGAALAGLDDAAGWLGPARSSDATPPRLAGRLRDARPRILLPELAAWSGHGTPRVLADRARAFAERGVPGVPRLGCPGQSLFGHVACWLVEGDARAGHMALAALDGFEIVSPRAYGQYGNAWQLALAYDLLARHPMLEPRRAGAVEERLEDALEEQLEVLDGGEASLWHGRATLSGYAWITAVALTPGAAHRDRLIARAQTHFLDALAALQLTEAWPEGYNYWIQNRALPLVLGASAYLNGLDDAGNADAVRSLLTRVGLWHVYATRPDHRIEGLGDEGRRLDLRHDTRPVIDVIVQATGDPVLAGYSRYLGRLHGTEAYGPETRWAFGLFNDPLVAPWPGTEDGDPSSLAYALPQAEVFGRGSMNQVYIRTGWGPDDTLIAFRAGDLFTHHGHYDAGHFSLFQGGLLAVNSSSYGDFFGPHRLHYAIRTVAKNSILVMRPGERVQPSPHFYPNVADGGQRVVLPTGSAIAGTADWRENLDRGLHLAGGELLRFDHLADSHAYLLADLTRAYNTPAHDEGGIGGKVRSVRRELFYLFEENVLLVHDDVETVDPRFLAKWLLHTIHRPEAEGLEVLRGGPQDGILETASDRALVRHGRGVLRVRRLLPENGAMRLVGGPNHRYYVEYDGDDRRLDGVNMSPGAAEDERFAVADWRIEIQPRMPGGRTRFLVALAPGLDRPSEVVVEPVPLTGGAGAPVPSAYAVRAGGSVVLFLEPPVSGPLTLSLPAGAERLYVVGLTPLTALRTVSDSTEDESVANRNGVAYSALDGRSGRLRLDW